MTKQLSWQFKVYGWKIIGDLFKGLGHIGSGSALYLIFQQFQHGTPLDVAPKEWMKAKLIDLERNVKEQISNVVVATKPGKIRICLDPASRTEQGNSAS